MPKALNRKKDLTINKKISSSKAHFNQSSPSYIACEDLELEQMDVTIAFLHGSLEEDLYVEQPKGFKAKGKTDLICKL